MCCRYYFADKEKELREIAAEAAKSPLARKFMLAATPLMTSGEIRPTNVVPVIAPGKNGQKAVFPMRWGFQIPGHSLVVNARVETGSEKQTFREAWQRHRCIIPASWYFEWEHLVGNNGQKKTGDKYLIQPKDSRLTWLCGLYRIEEGLPVFTILTREPSDELRRIHDRMPLILPEERIVEWITPDARPEAILPFALTEMYLEKQSGQLHLEHFSRPAP